MSESLKGSAYQVTEERTGPPLSHALEKMVYGILESHSLFNDLNSYISEDYRGAGELNLPDSATLKNDIFLSQAQTAFEYQLIAFLSLNNRLGMYQPDLPNELLNKNKSNLEAFLNRAEFIK